MAETREQLLERHNRELRKHTAQATQAAGVEYKIIVRGPANGAGQIDQHMRRQSRGGRDGYQYLRTERN